MVEDAIEQIRHTTIFKELVQNKDEFLTEMTYYAKRDIKKGEILIIDKNTMPSPPEWFLELLKEYK